MTINEFTVKDSFPFTKDIVEQDSNFYMGSLDVDSLFTNILLEETINVWTESIYDQNDTVEGLNKSGFKESYFISNEFLYKQIDCVSYGLTLSTNSC